MDLHLAIWSKRVRKEPGYLGPELAQDANRKGPDTSIFAELSPKNLVAYIDTYKRISIEVNKKKHTYLDMHKHSCSVLI